MAGRLDVDSNFEIRPGVTPVLVLLHGFGATREVWAPLIAALEPDFKGRWIAPDLRGHGRSPWGWSYGLGAHAADVADELIAEGAGEEVVVLGHSMGGAIAMALASGWFGVRPKTVLALGVKESWSEAELEGMRRLAGAAPKGFQSQDEAVARYLKVSGLHGLIDPDCEMATRGAVPWGEQWRLAADPKAALVGAPDFAALFAAARSPIRLARGEHDPMNTIEACHRWDPEAVELAGLGHSAMVEDPRAVLAWLKREAGW